MNVDRAWCVAVESNIKNLKTSQLANELVCPGGDTMTGAKTIALCERLERERRAPSADKRLGDMRAISVRCARLLAPGLPAIKHGDVLYDERGLPG